MSGTPISTQNRSLTVGVRTPEDVTRLRKKIRLALAVLTVKSGGASDLVSMDVVEKALDDYLRKITP